jgi:hypothetical protein
MIATLLHMLVTIGLVFGGMLLSLSLPAAELLTAVAMLVLPLLMVLLLSWPVYRLLHLRPLILPKCPSCGLRHNYHVPSEAWPVAVLVCPHCGEPFRIVLTGRPDIAVTPDLPTLGLRWPAFLGLWRRYF